MRWYHFLILLLVLYFFCGCRTEYVPVESVRYDSLLFTKFFRDSVYVKDSTHVRERGDTVFWYRMKYMFVNKTVSDTVYIERYKDRDVPVPVERKLSWWERQKVDYGGWAMLILVAAMLLKIRKWLARITRKE